MLIPYNTRGRNAPKKEEISTRGGADNGRSGIIGVVVGAALVIIVILLVLLLWLLLFRPSQTTEVTREETT